MAAEDEENALRLLRAINGDSANYKLNLADLSQILKAHWTNDATWAKDTLERSGFVFANPPYSADYLRSVHSWAELFKAKKYASMLVKAKELAAPQSVVQSLHTSPSAPGVASTYLEAVTKSVEQLKADLNEAEELRQLLIEFAQVQQLRRESAELYGPDPETGLTAAQEYLAFKKAKREQ